MRQAVWVAGFTNHPEGLRCNAYWRTVVLAGPSLNHAIMAWCPSHTLLAREWSQCSCKPARNAGTAVASKCASLQCQHCSSGTSSRLASSPFLLENDGGPPGEKGYNYLQHMHDNLHQSHRVAEIPGLVRGHEPFGGLQGQIHLQCNHQGVWEDDAVAIGFMFNAGRARAQRHTGWGDLQCHHYQPEGKVGVLASNMRTRRLVESGWFSSGSLQNEKSHVSHVIVLSLYIIMRRFMIYD